MITFFHTYDITTEVVVLIIIAVLLTIVSFSNPERTYMMKLCLCGTNFALFTIVVHIALLAETIHMRSTNSRVLFYIFYVIFALSDAVQLNLIFMYINQLSYKRRSQRKQMYKMACIYYVIYLTVMFIPMFKGTLLEYKDGIYSLSFHANAYVACSFICVTICILTTISNVKDLSTVVRTGMAIFAPITMIGVISQLYFPTAYFICATFTLPFLIFYMLFHALRYDEVMGCQNFDAEHNHLNSYMQDGKRFILFSVSCPRLEHRDIKDVKSSMVYIGNNLCRQVELIKRGIRIYRVSMFHFNVIAPVSDDDEFELIKNKLLTIMLNPVYVNGVEYKTPMKILISKEFESIKNVDDYISLINMKRREFDNPDITDIKYVTEDDCIKFKKMAVIEENLLDIRNKNNLDDDRVKVFIQPIYCISTGTFKTGESLMRLVFDGKMVFPDEFIPVAEDIGCIHALTRIMLNKVAKKTIELAKNREFDAITVNVSTVEMVDPNASNEFYSIIKNTGADPKHIRLEITESTTIKDYNTIISNINKLNEKGVHFYLDDFGTGYSNMERISSIPFKTIKFDKSLLYRALEDKKSEELFTLLLGFFKNNGFMTVIEGVEDEAQKEYVKSIGFDFIQGYLFSKPVPEAEVNHFFENN